MVRHANIRPLTQKNHHATGHKFVPKIEVEIILKAYIRKICDSKTQNDAPCALWARICSNINMPWPDVLLLASRDGSAGFAKMCAYSV